MFSEHVTKLQQEPKLTAYVSGDKKMCDAFQHGKDIYATIASLSFNLPYEKCLEFHPETGEYQPEGKARRGEAKQIVLGICYGRSVVTIADQLFGTDDTLTQEQKIEKAQKVYDSVLLAFPQLRQLMLRAQSTARKQGYVETILGRRRHIPDMQLPEFEFVPMPGYVNPDINPLDLSTLANKDGIPKRIVNQLEAEFKQYKYLGQIARRTRELAEQKIRVINNRPKITEASRKCVNCVDYDTEILTTAGWKRHDEVRVGDSILSYSLSAHEIVKDTVLAIHDNSELTEVVEFDTPTFSAVSTPEHRWVVGEADEIPRIKTTANIYKNSWPDYPILRVADNSFEANPNVTDAQLKVLGWIMTDGNIGKPVYAIHLYQSVRREKNSAVYQDMIRTLAEASIQVTDACRDGYYHEIYLKKNEFTKWVWDTFPDRVLSHEFINSLSQHQAGVLMRAMLQGDGSGVDGYGYPLRNSSMRLVCKGERNRDVFQHLCFVAGYATNSFTIDGSAVDHPSNHKLYDSMANIPVSNSIYYDIAVLKVQRAQIYPHHKSIKTVSGVWCITSAEGTWIARRNGKVYITGNSIIQGSAAELTKMAMLALEHDPDWNRIGGKLVLPVHDELIAEVPIEYWKEGGEILSRVMSEAGSFLPFTISCDVTTTLRWYGLEYPCKYTRPTSIDTVEPDEVAWIQYHLVELEYLMPVFKESDGSKPRGDKAVGVNGRISDEYQAAIMDYMNRYRLRPDQVIDHIDKKVVEGV